MAERKLPPKKKIYETLWAIADDRIQIEWFFGNEAKCYSSTWNKYYVVKHDESSRGIMTNDNWSYWQWYLWYPGIAFLMKKWLITYNPEYVHMFKNIPRKDLNKQFSNDFDKVLDYVLTDLKQKWMNIDGLANEIDLIYDQLASLHMNVLWQKIRPPQWY
jgi:hypothetical protein